MHLFVYYDVPGSEVKAVRERVLAMQVELSCAARLLRRPEHRDGFETWMETYEDVDAGFEQRLEAAVERHRLAPLTGPRHVERFEDFA